MWGEDPPSHTISINGGLFALRKNIHDFLIVMDERGQYNRWFFIDQLCIDQVNTAERNGQVSRMADTFANAMGVYIWLGPASDTSPQGIGLIRLFQAEMQVLASALRTCYGDLLERHETHVQALKELLQRPYWTRLWICQEIYLARRAWLFCGPDNVELQRSPYGNGYWQFRDLASQLQSFLDVRFRATALFNARSGDLMSLHSALWKFSEGGCADTRDKVYGICGCVEADQRVLVDYEFSAVDVFWETVRKLTEWKGARAYEPSEYGKMAHEGIYRTPPFWYLRNAMGLGEVVADEEIVRRFEDWFRQYHQQEPGDDKGWRWRELANGRGRK